ncbi:MAG: hypothetical protein HXY18_11365 [Bryobacteraceae bacterium]|nr:hypothetical protein [Bryobacteraceae bacterium]
MKKTFLVIPVALLMAGCETVSWLQPLYAPEDIVREESLAGSWRVDGEDTLTIAVEGDGYLLTIEDKKGGKTVYSAYLLRIGGELYADLTEKGGGIPDHMPVRIEMSGDRMTWFMLNSEWLRKRVKDGTLPSTRIAEGRKDIRWVVNVAPEEAQRLLRSYRYEAWEESVKLERAW